MALGDKIKHYRKRLNLTQEQLSIKLGISKHTFSKYEQNQRTPNIEMLKSISKALNVPVYDLMYDVGELKKEVTNIEQTEKLLNLLGYEIKIHQIDEEVFEVDVNSKDGLITLSSKEYDNLKENIKFILDYELYKLKNK